MTEAAGDANRVEVDVAIVGGGLAGLATATHLARRRKQVVCIEHRPWPRPAVGESLEFSAPGLLAGLGIDLATGDRQRHLFPKTSVRIIGDDEEFAVWPPRWFARPPIWCSRVAFHTDRTQLDQELLRLAVEEGVRILGQRVTKIAHRHNRITGLTTDRGTSVEARWYVDATGHNSRLFGHALDLDRELFSRSRTAYWARFAEPPESHATNLYFPRPAADNLTWAWEIPLNPDEVSVGVVSSTVDTRALRSSGCRPKDIYTQHVNAIPALRRLAAKVPEVELSATTYTPYRHLRSVGPNWLLVGDASAMVDPLTSNGVTAALRHAEQAGRTISTALSQSRLRRHQTWAFDATVPATVGTIDNAIESFLYRPDVRQRIGLQAAVTLYAGTGVITNSLYAKLNPITLPRSVACAAMLATSRAWTRVASSALPRLGPLWQAVARTSR